MWQIIRLMSPPRRRRCTLTYESQVTTRIYLTNKIKSKKETKTSFTKNIYRKFNNIELKFETLEFK